MTKGFKSFSLQGQCLMITLKGLKTISSSQEEFNKGDFAKKTNINFEVQDIRVKIYIINKDMVSFNKNVIMI